MDRIASQRTIAVLAQSTGGAVGLLTVVGTLAFVGACFAGVELLDRRRRPAPLAEGGPEVVHRADQQVVGSVGAADATSTWSPMPSGRFAREVPARTDVRAELRVAAVAAGALIVLTAAMVPWRDQLGSASVALVMVLVVVAAAARGGRRVAALTSAVAALAFNFGHTTPLYTFHIDTPADVVTSALMIVVGISVGAVAEPRTAR